MKKTKTQKLFEKLKPGVQVYVIIDQWKVKTKYNFNTLVPVLLKAKVKKYKDSYVNDKYICIALDIQKTTDKYVMIQDALNNIFFDKQSAMKRYKNIIKKHKSWIKKTMVVVENIEKNGFVLN